MSHKTLCTFLYYHTAEFLPAASKDFEKPGKSLSVVWKTLLKSFLSIKHSPPVDLRGGSDKFLPWSFTYTVIIHHDCCESYLTTAAVLCKPQTWSQLKNRDIHFWWIRYKNVCFTENHANITIQYNTNQWTYSYIITKLQSHFFSNQVLCSNYFCAENSST